MVTHPTTCQAFAELLVERCSVADLDKKVWADAIGVSEKNWSKYTRGVSMPTEETFAKVATKLFKMDPETLFEHLCERIALLSRRGIIRNAKGRFVPVKVKEPLSDDTSYAVAGEVLELTEPAKIHRPAGGRIDLHGLSPESAAYLRATHEWLVARDAR